MGRGIRMSDGPHIGALVDRMEAMPAAVRALLAGMGSEDACRRPGSGVWSIVEIVNHLADEEHEDFRTRVRLTLEDPRAPWPGIDPETSAIERGYQDRALDESVDRFCTERSRSIAWLRSLADPDWSTTHEHPSLGVMRAGDVMASWAAHDALHLRQIAKRMYELTLRDTPGFSSAYAGEWGA